MKRCVDAQSVEEMEGLVRDMPTSLDQAVGIIAARDDAISSGKSERRRQPWVDRTIML